MRPDVGEHVMVIVGIYGNPIRVKDGVFGYKKWM